MADSHCSMFAVILIYAWVNSICRISSRTGDKSIILPEATNRFSIIENQPYEICSHFSEKAWKGTFLKPDKPQNHSNEGKEKEKKKERREGKEEKKKKKEMLALLVFIIAILEKKKVYLAIFWWLFWWFDNEIIIRENKSIDQFPTPKHQKIWLPFWKLLAFNVIITARWVEYQFC